MNRYLSTADELVVADAMTLDPATISMDAPLEEAERLMRERHVTGLPVVDANGAPIGVISQTDVIADGGTPLAMLLRHKPNGLRVGELMTTLRACDAPAAQRATSSPCSRTDDGAQLEARLWGPFPQPEVRLRSRPSAPSFPRRAQRCRRPP